MIPGMNISKMRSFSFLLISWLLVFPTVIHAQLLSWEYEDIFTEEGYVHFQRFLSGLLISENKTIQAINRLFVLDLKDQSSLNRFLNSSPFDEEKLNTRRLEMLQSNEHTCFKYPLKGCPKGTHPGCISVDDTLLEHVGKKIDGIYVIWCHVKGCYVYAHQLVTLHYSDDKCDYPICWEFSI